MEYLIFTLPTKIGRFITIAITWIAIMILYPKLVTLLSETDLFGLDLVNGVNALQFIFFGLPITLLSIHWLIIIIGLYKIIDAAFDGLILSIINVVLIGLLIVGTSWGNLKFQIAIGESVLSLTLLISELLWIIFAIYAAKLASEIVTNKWQHDATDAICEEVYGSRDDDRCLCFSPFVWNTKEQIPIRELTLDDLKAESTTKSSISKEKVEIDIQEEPIEIVEITAGPPTSQL